MKKALTIVCLSICAYCLYAQEATTQTQEVKPQEVVKPTQAVPAPAPAAQSVPAAPKPAVSVNSMASYQRGRDLESNGDNQNAQAKYLEALKAADIELSQNAKRIDSYVVKAWCQLRLKRYADVISTGSIALRISDDMRMVEVMGEAYFYLNQMDDCIRYLQLYVNNVPETAERLATAYFFMGEVYSIRKQWEHADISYTLSVYYAPSMARWWYRLGGAKEAKSDMKGALQAYEKSVALLPSATAFVEARNRVKSQVGQ